MCKIGDLVIVYSPKVNSRNIGTHPFVVLDDSNGTIRGMYEYDFISLLLTSYEDGDEERKKQLGRREGNLHIAKEDKLFIDTKYRRTNRNSYIEANNFFYFSKEKVSYKKIGRLDEDVYNYIVDFIVELNGNGIAINQILDGAKNLSDEE